MIQVALSEIRTVSFPTRAVASYTYGPDGRLTNPGAFRYDVDGRVTDDERGPHYEWDNQGRLVRARAKNVETTWAYDCSR